MKLKPLKQNLPFKLVLSVFCALVTISIYASSRLACWIVEYYYRTHTFTRDGAIFWLWLVLMLLSILIVTLLTAPILGGITGTDARVLSNSDLYADAYVLGNSPYIAARITNRRPGTAIADMDLYVPITYTEIKAALLYMSKTPLRRYCNLHTVEVLYSDWAFTPHITYRTAKMLMAEMSASKRYYAFLRYSKEVRDYGDTEPNAAEYLISKKEIKQLQRGEFSETEPLLVPTGGNAALKITPSILAQYDEELEGSSYTENTYAIMSQFSSY